MIELQDNETVEEESEVITWLKENAISLESIDPESSTRDLEPLKKIVEKARLVGLGEATHGNREFTLVRHKILRFLIEKVGFKGLVLETPQEEAKKVDSFVKTGKGAPKELLSQLGYWLHNTEELLDVIEWMKSYNQKHHENQIGFFGCDISWNDSRRENGTLRDQAMAENCLNLLDKTGNKSKLALWMHNTHVSNLDIPTFKTTGSFLRDKLGNKYINFATLFNEGDFLARRGTFSTNKAGQIEKFTFEESQKNSYASYFKITNNKYCITDLRSLKTNKAFQAWNEGRFTTREVGAIYDPAEENMYTQHIDLPNKYDCVIWIDKVTPSILLF